MTRSTNHLKAHNETAASSEDHLNGGDNMEDDKILEKYIDTVDKDRREMEKRLTEDGQESEKRITEERRLSEDRMEKRFNEVMSSIKDLNQGMSKNISSMNTKIDEGNKYLRSLTLSTIWSVAGIAFAVMALVVTVILNG